MRYPCVALLPYLWGALLILFLLTTPPVSAQVAEQDSLALVDLYNSTGGPNWTHNDNWLQGSVEAWYGVRVSGGRVTEISLPLNNLQGNLPSSIGDLSALTRLGLSGNGLTGPIPPETGNLRNLVVLDLGGEWDGTQWVYNNLTGPIPPELGDLSNLEWLDLNHNRFTDLPSLQGLQNLRRLWVQQNRLTFEDIEPNMGVASEEFLYAPQDSVGVERDTTVFAGDTLRLEMRVGGWHNVYRWRKNGVPAHHRLPGADLHGGIRLSMGLPHRVGQCGCGVLAGTGLRPHLPTGRPGSPAHGLPVGGHG